MPAHAGSLRSVFPSRRVLVARSAVVLLTVGLWCAAPLPAAAAMPQVGASAEDFQLADLAGQTVQLQRLLQERPALVVFSSVGCIPCEESAPAMQRLAERFGDRVEVLAVMLSEEAAVRRWLATGERYPGTRILVGPNGDTPYATAREYGVLGTPTAFLIGQDNAVLWRHVGRISAADMDGEVAALLAAGPAAPDGLVAVRSAP